MRTSAAARERPTPLDSGAAGGGAPPYLPRLRLHLLLGRRGRQRTSTDNRLTCEGFVQSVSAIAARRRSRSDVDTEAGHDPEPAFGDGQLGQPGRYRGRL